jgi:prepilin-type N-terminal cleavage/methylation domain-containing protein
MKILHRSKKGGFTLIELLVVIAIIAILTGIIITGLVGSKAKARDAQRASDLSQISLALELYFARCDQYPTPDTGSKIDNNSLNDGNPVNGVTVCPMNNNGQVTLGSFISKIPTDPSTGNPYDYVTNGTPPSDFVLHTTFESPNSVSTQSAPEPSWSSGFSCPTNPSSTNLIYCVRPN